MTKKHLLLLILFSLTLKVLYLVFSISVDQTDRSQSFYQQYKKAVWKNDSGYYQRIANDGYIKIIDESELTHTGGDGVDQTTWAFFPFYPLTIRFFSKVFHIKNVDSTFFISIIFSTLSIIGFYWFSLFFFKDESLAFFEPLVMFCFPFAFYYSMFYTEALFFSFMIFGFIAIHYRKHVALSLLLIPLVLIRPNGIIILIPLYLFYLERNNVLDGFRVYWKQFFGQKNILTSLFFATGPIAFLLYCYYQYEMTGHFFAFSVAQKGWNREYTFPLFSLFNRGGLATLISSIFAIIAMIYSAMIWKKLPLSLNVLIWINILLPLSTGTSLSMPRYLSVVFPLFLILGASIYNMKYKYLIVLGLFILQLITFYPWLIRHPVSF